MTQRDFAKVVGVSDNTLGRIERGEESVRLAKVRQVAEALGLEVAPPVGDVHAAESAKVMVELWIQALPEPRRGAALHHLARSIANFPG